MAIAHNDGFGTQWTIRACNADDKLRVTCSIVNRLHLWEYTTESTSTPAKGPCKAMNAAQVRANERGRVHLACHRVLGRQYHYPRSMVTMHSWKRLPRKLRNPKPDVQHVASRQFYARSAGVQVQAGSLAALGHLRAQTLVGVRRTHGLNPIFGIPSRRVLGIEQGSPPQSNLAMGARPCAYRSSRQFFPRQTQMYKNI